MVDAECRMEHLGRMAARLVEILGLSRSPVAVTFLSNEDALPEGYDTPPGVRYCQVLMMAGAGRRVLLTPENIACPASAAALGFHPLPDKLASGAMLSAYGIFGSDAAGRHTMETMPRLPMDKYSAVAACPLQDATLPPDVVVLESRPEHLMWVALAAIRQSGGRLNLSTAILQATCVDGTILPFLEGRLNATLGCYGCREATDMDESECILGFPARDLEPLMVELEALAAKAMPRVRGKGVYQAQTRRA